ncbi:hypothetical protein BB558_006992 [Smittium angustum]|uniref:leucine--tRNA ligase n=2 Tax=Harpellales TaxID=61421 RepID=A0A2U1IWB1_SMIAN|nr:hypothetical protein BB558_006992 [Smittium angustum]
MFSDSFKSVKEPFKQLLTQGMVHGITYKEPSTERYLKPDEVDVSKGAMSAIIKATGEKPLISFEKMSKSKYNGVDPRPVVSHYGADVLRLYMLFKAAPQDVLEYDTSSIIGMQRWIAKLSKITELISRRFDNNYKELIIENRSEWTQTDKNTYLITQKAIKKVTEAFETNFLFNTSIAMLIELSNHIHSIEAVNNEESALHITTCYAFDTLLRMLSPFAPVTSEELFEKLYANDNSYRKTIFAYDWPKLDESGLIADMLTCVVQVNGKVRFKMDIDSEIGKDEKKLQEVLLESEHGKKWLYDNVSNEQHPILRVVVVKGGKLVNFITRNKK